MEFCKKETADFFKAWEASTEVFGEAEGKWIYLPSCNLLLLASTGYPWRVASLRAVSSTSWKPSIARLRFTDCMSKRKIPIPSET